LQRRRNIRRFRGFSSKVAASRGRTKERVMTTRAFIIAAAAWLGAAASSPALAQGPSQQFSDEQVGAFVDALGAAALVAEEWAPRIEGAQNAEEANAMTAQSQDEMVAAIEQSGISLEDYNAIFITAQSDPELAERVNLELEERIGDHP
jgi:hypothetical protein